MSIEFLEECIRSNKRFHIQPEDKYGRMIIFDVLNTEPVCVIYSKYHSYAPKIILDGLEKFESKVKMMKKTLEILKRQVGD